MEGSGNAEQRSCRVIGRRHLVVCLVLATFLAPAARADPQADFAQAVAADLAGDAAKAFGYYSEAAKSGLAEAQFNVGLMYDSGRGTRHDPASAALFYAFAAANGSARGASSLGLLYEAGDGVPRNAQVAEAWFRAAGRIGLTDDSVTKRRARIDATAPAAAANELQAAHLVYPTDGGVIPATQDFVPLVWTSVQEPEAPLFFIELVALGGTSPKPILTETRDITATRAPIGRQAGMYAWRVFTFSQSKGTYVATDWMRFTIG